MSSVTDRQAINEVAMEFLAPELRRCQEGPAAHVASVVEAELSKDIDPAARSV